MQLQSIVSWYEKICDFDILWSIYCILMKNHSNKTVLCPWLHISDRSQSCFSVWEIYKKDDISLTYQVISKLIVDLNVILVLVVLESKFLELSFRLRLRGISSLLDMYIVQYIIPFGSVRIHWILLSVRIHHTIHYSSMIGGVIFCWCMMIPVY